MKLKNIFLTLFCFFFSISSVSAQTGSATITPAQKTQYEQIIHDYILKNPQIILEAVQALQRQQLQTLIDKMHQGAIAHAKELFNSPTSPTFGDANAKITLVEFYDYQCPHCRTMAPIISQFQKSNPGLRIVYKEFPIFPNSRYIAQAALAAHLQDKFLTFHEAIWQAQPPLTQDKILKISETVGLDLSLLKSDMQKPAVQKEIDDNLRLGKEIGIAGTPALFIASNVNDPNKIRVFVIPGETSLEMLQKYIAQLNKQ